MPKLLDQVHAQMRVRRYSLKTERAYVGWIKRYTIFNNKQHPTVLGPARISHFLSHLAWEKGVSAPTQNQALAALLFLFTAPCGLTMPTAHFYRFPQQHSTITRGMA